MRLSAAPLLACLLIASSAWAQVSEPVSSGAPRVEEFRIGIEDQLLVYVWGEADLSMSVRVRPDGRITLPLVNDVQVAGMTPDDVRKEIASKLSSYIKDPNVTVIVEEINSFKVYILGSGIGSQGIQNFSEPTRLLQAIAAAGGFAEFAKKKIKIFRRRGAGEVRIDVDFKQILENGIGDANLFLEPGDTLIVN